MTPILEARKKKIAEETKKFTTYKNCPLCRGYFHAAKACIFRTHVKHFNILKRRMELYSDEVNSTTRMYVPTTNLDSDSDSQDEDEEECDYSDDESDVEECYMIVTHHGNSSEEESMDEDNEDQEDDFSSRLRQITRFDKVLTIVTKQKKIHQDEEDQDEDDQDEDDQDEDEQTKDDQKEDSNDEDQDLHGEGQSGEEQQEDQEEEAYEDYPDQDQDKQDQQNEDQMDTDPEDGIKLPIFKEVKFMDNPEGTSCELSRRSFETSICKILQDTAEFPEDIFNIEGCIWCSSKGHDVFNCLGYATLLGDLWLGQIEERRVTYPQRQKRIESMLKEAKDVYQTLGKPWELYTGLDDGEYLTEKGVKIKIMTRRLLI